MPVEKLVPAREEGEGKGEGEVEGRNFMKGRRLPSRVHRMESAREGGGRRRRRSFVGGQGRPWKEVALRRRWRMFVNGRIVWRRRGCCGEGEGKGEEGGGVGE